MTKLKIHRGTPSHGDTLCRSCQHGMFVEGQQLSKVKVLCSGNNYGSPIPISFPVARCSEYNDRADLKLQDMKEIAWGLVTKGNRQIGFVSPAEFKKRTAAEEQG